MSRQAALVLAFLALSLVVAQPICQVVDSHIEVADSSSRDSGTCCANVGDSRLVAADEPLPSFESRLPLLRTAPEPPALGPYASSRASLLWQDGPPISRRYHARSARILL